LVNFGHTLDLFVSLLTNYKLMWRGNAPYVAYIYRSYVFPTGIRPAAIFKVLQRLAKIESSPLSTYTQPINEVNYLGHRQDVFEKR